MKTCLKHLLLFTVFSASFITCSAQVQTDTLTKALPDKTIVIIDTIKDVSTVQSAIPAGFGEFPTLHPIIVHFAISLIVVAALMQVLNIFFFRKEIAWTILFLMLTGVIAALIASRIFHPHIKEVPDHAFQVLLMHEKFAEWTIRTGVAVIILQLLHILLGSFRNRTISTPKRTITFAHRKNRLLMIVIAAIALSSSWFVFRAGHLGAQLVHIEGVGPQGKYLERGHKD